MAKVGQEPEMCGDIFGAAPDVEAECIKDKGHKGKHKDEWVQSDKMATKIGSIKVTWKRVRDDD